MSEWRECTLGDVLTLQRGFDITKAAQIEGSVPVVSSSGINSFHDRPMVEAPGVVIGRKGSLGTCFFLDRAFWPHDTTLWVKDFKGNDPKYCYYLLRGMDLAKHDVGAANPTLNRNHVHLLRVLVPDLDAQRRIASILGAYDDLIEVNRRRITLLEEMARGLFEEWFVRFRFPGHEEVAILDTPDGPLPEGWTRDSLESFLILQRGFDLPKGRRVNGDIPVFSASGLHGGHNEHRVSGPGIVTGRSGTIGQVHLIMENFWPLNTTLYVREFKRAGPAYAMLLLQHMDLSKYSGGAAVPTLNRNHIHNISLPAAPQALIDKFESFAFTNFKSIRTMQKQNDHLAASRDLLLPRLISGQLSLTQAERELEEAA